MDNTGKAIRIKRIFRKNDRRCLIVPMDHGVTAGLVPGLVDMRSTLQSIVHGGADAVVIHKGFVSHYARLDAGTALIMHLSAGTSFYEDGNSKVLVASVEDAVRAGADAVSIHVTLGSPDENAMLRDFGQVSRATDRWGMPLLAMIYARGKNISNPYAAEVVAHAARIGVELGADIIKVPYCGNMDEFTSITASSPVPVVIAGGYKLDSALDVLRLAYDGIRAGAAGLSIGRNVFQFKNSQAMTRALCSIIHDGYSVDLAMKYLEQPLQA